MGKGNTGHNIDCSMASMASPLCGLAEQRKLTMIVRDIHCEEGKYDEAKVASTLPKIKGNPDGIKTSPQPRGSSVW